MIAPRTDRGLLAVLRSSVPAAVGILLLSAILACAERPGTVARPAEPSRYYVVDRAGDRGHGRPGRPRCPRLDAAGARAGPPARSDAGPARPSCPRRAGRAADLRRASCPRASCRPVKGSIGLPDRSLPCSRPARPRPGDKELPGRWRARHTHRQPCRARAGPAPSPVAAAPTRSALGQTELGVGRGTRSPSASPTSRTRATSGRSRKDPARDGTERPFAGQQPAVVFEIRRDGRLNVVTIDKSSGNASTIRSRSARSTTRARFRHYPTISRNPCSRIGLQFVFDPTGGDRCDVSPPAALLTALVVATAVGLWAPPPPAGAQAPGRLHQRHRGRQHEAQHRPPRLHGHRRQGRRRALEAPSRGRRQRSHAIGAVQRGRRERTASPPNNAEALRQTWNGLRRGRRSRRRSRPHDDPRRSRRGRDTPVRPDGAGPAPDRVTQVRRRAAADQPGRRLAHKIADEIVLQFTGEKGVADTKISLRRRAGRRKEIVVADYDGFGTSPVTRNGSINLSPVWSPDARSIAFTSFMNGYPDLFRLFPFEPRRGVQTLSSFHGINSSPSLEPRRQLPRAHALEGRQSRGLRAHGRDRGAPASHASRLDRHGAHVVTHGRSRSRSCPIAPGSRVSS